MSDEPALIYLEADDEITAVVRRVRAATAGRVVIVAPGRSRATSSAVALQLLARATSDDAREIAVVGDELTRSLAAEAGLTAYRSVDDARSATSTPSPQDAAPPRHAAIHVVRGPAGDDTAPTLATFPAAEADTRPIRVVAPPPSSPPESGPSRRPRPARPARGLGRPRPNALVAVLGIAAAFVVVAAVLGAIFLPAATIAITPRSEPVGPVVYTITIDDPQRTTGTVTETATVTASGSYAVEAAATGAVTFRNFNIGPIEVPAGTPVGVGEDIVFTTTEAIVVPEGSLTGEGTIAGGEASAGITAAAIGPGGNVAAGAIDTVLDQQVRNRLRGFPQNRARLVFNAAETAGGVAGTGLEITQADVDAAVQQLRDALASGLATALEGTDSGLFADPAEPAEPVITGTDGLVGTRDQAEAEISGEVAYDRLTVDPDEVEALAQERFVSDGAPDGTQLMTDEIDVVIGDVSREGDTLAAEATVSGRATAMVSREHIVQAIIGLSEAEAEAALAPLGQADVTLWPGWVATVPDREWRIAVEISGAETPIDEPSPS